MDIIQLYQDFSIPYATEGHKHTRPGWVNVECPFCVGNPGLHLGFNLESEFYVCWRCGAHHIIPTLSKLLHKSEQEVRVLIRQYGITTSHAKLQKVEIRRKAFKYPSETGPLGNNHIRYLQERGFDPDLLIKIWQLKGTGPISKLSTGSGADEKIINYKHRIIIPYIWDGKEVSFDSRSISINGSDKTRYIACPKDRELIPHKEILYGKQECWKDSIIVVEGPTDVWRFGTNACCTSGIKFTPKQVRVLANTFKRIFVYFDDEPQAIAQAKKLVNELRFRNVEAIFIESIISNDPGSMKQEDADYLVKQLIH